MRTNDPLDFIHGEVVTARNGLGLCIHQEIMVRVPVGSSPEMAATDTRFSCSRGEILLFRVLGHTQPLGTLHPLIPCLLRQSLQQAEGIVFVPQQRRTQNPFTLAIICGSDSIR